MTRSRPSVARTLLPKSENLPPPQQTIERGYSREARLKTTMRSRDLPRSKRSPMREEAPSPAAPSPASSGGKRKSRDSVVVEEKWVPFEPSDRDVVSTKIRTWNSKHPANVYYSELVKAHVDRVPPVDSNGHSEVVKGIAGDIIDELTIARGGRFLKLREGDLTPTECVVMTRKQITIKVVRALRELHAKVVSGIPVSPAKEVINTTKHISVSGLFFEKHHSPSKTAAAAPPLPPPSKSKTSSKGSGGVIKTTNTRKSISPAPPASQSESETESVVPTPPPPKTYFLVDDCLAKKPLDFYLKLCINSVCNFIKPDICYQALDQPLNNYTLESEPDKYRLMRLQVSDPYVFISNVRLSGGFRYVYTYRYRISSKNFLYLST